VERWRLEEVGHRQRDGGGEIGVDGET
jgi:hypothetical protein